MSTRVERLGTMGSRHGHDDARLADAELTDPVDDRDAARGPAFQHLVGELAQAHLRELVPGLVGETGDLAGVGVALKLVQALGAATGRESWLPGFVKIVAIGTLADVVPLVGENRVIAKLGLDLLSRGPHKVGLRSLLDVAGLLG